MTTLSRSNVIGQGHHATLLTATLTHEAGAAVTVRTHWAWETTATLHLLGGARGTGAPTGEERGGAYRVAMRTADLPDSSTLSQTSAKDARP